MHGGGAVRLCSLDDVTAWVSGAGQDVLAALGCRRDALGVITPPHPDTITRVFAGLGAQRLAGHTGTYLARRALAGPVTFAVTGPGWLPAIAVDGKAVRGAIGADGLIPYLLAAATHRKSAVIAERRGVQRADRSFLGAHPVLEVAAVPRDDEQRVVDPHAQPDQDAQRRADRGNAHPVGEQPDSHQAGGQRGDRR